MGTSKFEEWQIKNLSNWLTVNAAYLRIRFDSCVNVKGSSELTVSIYGSDDQILDGIDEIRNGIPDDEMKGLQPAENPPEMPDTKEPRKSRKVVQISSYKGKSTHYTMALCDDGTMWQIDDVSKEWYRLIDIPQEGDADDQ